MCLLVCLATHYIVYMIVPIIQCTYITYIPSPTRAQVHRLVTSAEDTSPSPLRERHLAAALRVVDTLYPAEPKAGPVSPSATAARIVVVSAVRSLFDMCHGNTDNAVAWAWVWA